MARKEIKIKSFKFNYDKNMQIKSSLGFVRYLPSIFNHLCWVLDPSLNLLCKYFFVFLGLYVSRMLFDKKKLILNFT